VTEPVNAKSQWKSHALLAVLAALLVGLDQWTKLSISDYFARGSMRKPIPVLGGLIHLTYTQNTGGAFGMWAGETVSIALLLISTIALGFIAWYYWQHREHLPVRVALSLIAAGAVGNFVDRIRLRYVVDFIDVDLGSYQWPYFNIADTLICVGAGLLVLLMLMRRQPDVQSQGADDAA